LRFGFRRRTTGRILSTLYGCRWVAGVDTVAVPDFDIDTLGHSYFARAEALLHDIHDLMRRDAKPSNHLGGSDLNELTSCGRNGGILNIAALGCPDSNGGLTDYESCVEMNGIKDLGNSL
jgi:hypothetical protein